MTKADADYLWNLMPDWVKQQSTGLSPMSYGTTTYEGDVMVHDRVRSILFNPTPTPTEVIMKEKPVRDLGHHIKLARSGHLTLPTFEWDGQTYFLDLMLGMIHRADGLEFTQFVDITNEDLKAHIRGVRTEHYGQFYVRGLDD